MRPLRQPVRRLPYGEMRAAVESEIDKLVAAEIARPSTSPWASPVVMVRKKDGSWRMCVDYPRLNSVTKFDCFSLPRLDETLDSFAGLTVFSSLARSRYGVPSSARQAVRCREDCVNYAYWFVRNAKDAVRPLQRAVDVSTADVQRFTESYRPHLSRVS